LLSIVELHQSFAKARAHVSLLDKNVAILENFSNFKTKSGDNDGQPEGC
jgi:hypothetical protein